jgi:hypothetical protein
MRFVKSHVSRVSDRSYKASYYLALCRHSINLFVPHSLRKASYYEQTRFKEKKMKFYFLISEAPFRRKKEGIIDFFCDWSSASSSRLI